MKTPLFSTIALSIAAMLPGLAQTTENVVRVAEFAGDRKGAISYTFDDGLRNHYLLAAPILKEVGLHATFFIVPGRVSETQAEAEAKKPGEMGALTWEEIREMGKAGNEIASHSWSHTSPKGVDDVRAHEELSKAGAKIQQEVGIYPLTFAYPGNARDARSRELVLQYHVEAREYETRMGKEHTTPDGLNAWADKQATEQRWGVGMIHGLVDGYDPIDPVVLRAHLAYVKTREADLWVDTFGNIARYVRERDAAQIQISNQTAESVTFTLDTPLARPPFEFPLTAIVTAPGAETVKAERNGKTLPVSVKTGIILVEVAPGKEPITVTWKKP